MDFTASEGCEITDMPMGRDINSCLTERTHVFLCPPSPSLRGKSAFPNKYKKNQLKNRSKPPKYNRNKKLQDLLPEGPLKVRYSPKIFGDSISAFWGSSIWVSSACNRGWRSVWRSCRGYIEYLNLDRKRNVIKRKCKSPFSARNKKKEKPNPNKSAFTPKTHLPPPFSTPPFLFSNPNKWLSIK